MSDLKICSRCVYNETVPGIEFDAHGICNYCKMHDDLDQRHPVGHKGDAYLREIAEEMRKAGRGKEFDCIVGVSGGCDSSYMLYYAKEIMGLRPLAVHYDNTWNSGIASQNIYKMCTALDVKLETYVVDNVEADDILMAFMKAGIKEIDAATDLGLAATLYMACEKHGVRYILEGHSFRTEGVSPLGWAYFDGKFIASVHKAFGTVRMKTYPNLTFYRFLKWSIFNQIKRYRPLWHIDYNKESTKRFLSDRFGWNWYGGHHLENRTAAISHLYIFPQQANIDLRLLGHAALTRIGQMSRDEALLDLKNPPVCPDDLMQTFCVRLGITESEFEAYMDVPSASWTTFQTYKKWFEFLRPVFWLLMKLDRVPESFYMKYCLKR
ncbi:hypothetical protein N8000_05845 [Rhodospirillales bacterium]|nr:hypothetical protein [Rhodospirillales bacterium]